MAEARVVFAAPASGSGKTTVVCGVLQALRERGMRPVSFKCGPDYIDPMFHERALGVPSGNLDLFFSDPDTLRRLFLRDAEGAELAVIEGVMGYYDGLGAATDAASTYRVAEALDAPAVLIVDARGQSLSALATLTGFLRYRPDSRIRGVIFNRMSGHVYNALRPEAARLGVRPLGYLPKLDDLSIESRHLGLITPGEIADLSGRLHRLAEALEETVDLDGLLGLAASASPLPRQPEPVYPDMPKTRIAVARDEAFCFLYKDNLRLLGRFGAELVYFSPLRDAALPSGTQGLILPGGYPELYAETLSGNRSMRQAIREALRNGLPCLAECGGFLYLHRELEDAAGISYPMVDIIPAKAWRTERLGRFGYVTLSAKRDGGLLRPGETVRGHEFHYWESGDCGRDLLAEKPAGGRRWDCAHVSETLYAGFPHLFYESNPKLIERFLRRCAGEEVEAWQGH